MPTVLATTGGAALSTLIVTGSTGTGGSRKPIGKHGGQVSHASGGRHSVGNEDCTGELEASAGRSRSPRHFNSLPMALGGGPALGKRSPRVSWLMASGVGPAAAPGQQGPQCAGGGGDPGLRQLRWAGNPAPLVKRPAIDGIAPSDPSRVVVGIVARRRAIVGARRDNANCGRKILCSLLIALDLNAKQVRDGLVTRSPLGEGINQATRSPIDDGDFLAVRAENVPYGRKRQVRRH